MLFLLTGTVQTGKTRWLTALVDELEARGVSVSGVLAPGVWRKTADGLEKLGIDNLLLPQCETVPFGRRADLALEEGAFDERWQSAQAGLSWIFPDESLDRVNAHCAELRCLQEGDAGDACGAQPAVSQAGFLVIDELGKLELLRDGGLSEAVALVRRGPSRPFPHALAVVRESLLPQAHERFDAVWEAVEEVFPNDYSKTKIISLYN